MLSSSCAVNAIVVSERKVDKRPTVRTIPAESDSAFSARSQTLAPCPCYQLPIRELRRLEGAARLLHSCCTAAVRGDRCFLACRRHEPRHPPLHFCARLLGDFEHALLREWLAEIHLRLHRR